ncbi:cadherin-related family member 5 isoform X1 [Nannospalax galili]|uniref:cadherin-related family member 5 isoform X1 n=1 Tax=Nannospalax galili TaxID=1026970 RepID=UPI000819F2BD|nr:cadherin-related family member 5 isoform X1 [Nannospalax galili]
MRAPALLWPVLLLPLLIVLFSQPPRSLVRAQTQVCSVSQNFVQVKENVDVTDPLVNISVPEGQQVTLGSSSTPSAFRILENQLFLNVTPDYEENSVLQAYVECKRDSILVTQLVVFVSVLDVNDNEPEFPFEVKECNVTEDTRVGTTVITEEGLRATDPDKNDVLFYTLQEMTPDASSFFYLMGPNQPALMLNRTLDFYKNQNMTFQLLVRDTWEVLTESSHTATATLILNVLPADLRPPWFLPCSYSDDYNCVQAHYEGAVPIGQKLPSPLILSPGPIYAVDGDKGINQRIIYSIIAGNTDDTFTIDANSGNLTMAKDILSPTTFTLVVRADQEDMAQNSVTQVTVKAQDLTESPFQFSRSLYHGTVALGSGAGTRVMDAASPSESLRIWAQYPNYPDLNLAITYRITNCTKFKMDEDTILTTEAMENVEVFYAEVEATESSTGATATTVVEIQVSEQKTPSTEFPTSPETGGTAGSLSSTTSEAPKTSVTSQGPTTTSSGGSPGPLPPSSTTLSPPASSTPVEPSTAGNSTSSQPSTPSGDSTQTPRPGTSQPVVPTAGTGTSPKPVTPSGGSTQTPRPGTSQLTTPTAGTSTSPQPAQTPKPGTSQPTTTEPSRTPLPSGDNGDGHFSTVDMAVLGGVLGALLLLALICLAVLIHKHYGHQLNCCSGKASELSSGFDNDAFVPDRKASWTPTSSPEPEPGPVPAKRPPSPPSSARSSPVPPSSEPLSLASAPDTPETARAGDSPSAVRSILTKERRPESGYKAVWFGEDIGAEADVVVLNAPTVENEGSEDEGQDENDGPHHGADADSTYI